MMLTMLRIDATAFPFGLTVELGTDDMHVGCRLCVAVRLCT